MLFFFLLLPSGIGPITLLFPDSYVGSRLWSRTVKTQINLLFSKENYNVSGGSPSTNTGREIWLPGPHLFLQGVLCVAVYQLFGNKYSPGRTFPRTISARRWQSGWNGALLFFFCSRDILFFSPSDFPVTCCEILYQWNFFFCSLKALRRFVWMWQPAGWHFSPQAERINTLSL